VRGPWAGPGAAILQDLAELPGLRPRRFFALQNQIVTSLWPLSPESVIK
jgi:hypothetical protein